MKKHRARCSWPRQYFSQDSLKLALNGDGNNLGFIDIAESIQVTKSGKLANFYAGTCLMHLGQFEEAYGLSE
ncbi:MAG: hypothetical protein MZV63_23435 [Marinilabiliales bacterium]|nr:hypothetical protein [Marinilabiliales bacterium]